MSELGIAAIAVAAGSIITYCAMKASEKRVKVAQAPLARECAGLRQRNHSLESAITERRVSDAYQAGIHSRDAEVEALHQDISKLREQVRLEAALDDRIRGRGYASSAGGKIINITNGRG